MKKFIVIYYADKEAMEQMKNETPELVEKSMKPWMEWKEKYDDLIIDLGAPLGNGQKIMSDGSEPSDKNIAGYSIIQAEDMNGAKAMLEGHPHLVWTKGCSIEVYEAMPHSRM